MNIEKIIENIIEKKLGLEVEEIKPPHAHRMQGIRCILRTYSAGIHFGKVDFAEGTEVELEDSCRLWSWEKGGLSLSAVNRNGMKGGRVNRTGRIYLTEVIELIPTTDVFEKSWEAFLEDEKK